ncbi:MAG: TM2 domain-containing protein [Acutalibacteraceae bacterium]|nr:TM2 domain-containing protein [Acutalibacteraceae bacterium]
MYNLNCPQCGAPITSYDTECRYCGEKLPQNQKASESKYNQSYFDSQYSQSQYQQNYPDSQYYNNYSDYKYPQSHYQQSYSDSEYTQSRYQPNYSDSHYPQPQHQQSYYPQTYSTRYDDIDPQWPIKNKVVAGLLGIFTGGFGIHKFYLGKNIMGVIYLLLFWTSIPSIIGIIEGLTYLLSDDHKFQVKNQVRLY